MWLSLRRSFKTLYLWTTGSRPPRRVSTRPIDLRWSTENAAALLRKFHDPMWGTSQIRRFLLDEAWVDPSRYQDHELLPVLANLLAKRRVSAAIEIELLPLPPPVERVEPPPPPEPVVTTTWIEVQLVWDHDGKGVGEVEFELEAPNQERQKVKTNGDGILRVDGIPRGACHLEAELKDAQAATSATPVAWGPDSSGSLPPEKPEEIKHLVAATRHHVRSGETLESIAESAGMSWKALAKFNWGTDDKKEVKKFLLARVGTWVDDPAMDPFDDGDDPGVLFVPRPFEARGLATSQRHVLRVAPLTWEAPFTQST